MSGKNLDPRVQRTRAAFQNALLNLLRTKPFEKIRIKEIANHAGFSRHAFYSHFDSKEALLFSYVDNLFEEIARVIYEEFEQTDEVELNMLMEKSFDLWREHAETMNYVMQVEKKGLIIMRIRTHAAIVFELYTKTRNSSIPNHPLQDYILEFVIGGWFLLIQRWANDGMVQDSATMAQLMLEVTPITLLVGVEHPQRK